MQIRSFKLRMMDEAPRVRVVPKTDAEGCPFQGPGVDLLGESALRVLEAAKPLLDAIAAFEPGVLIRSVSFDLEKPRLLATLSPLTKEADPRPRVVRIEEGPALSILLPLAQAMAQAIATEAALVLQKRRGQEK